MIVADTDVLIDFLEGSDPAASRIALELQYGGLATTVVTRFELLSGVRNERQERTVQGLVDALVTLPLGQAAADKAARVRQDLQRQGAPIEMADCLIAGIVLDHGAILLTRNRRHFERVEGLRLGLLTLPER